MFKYLKYLVVCIVFCTSLFSCVKDADLEPCCGDQIQIPDEPKRPGLQDRNG